MSRIPQFTGLDVVKVFKRFGWKVARQRGSHIILVKKGHIATLSVPAHDEVAKGTLRALVARASLTMEDFLKKA